MKKLYSIFDDVADDSLAPFVANNDEHAILMVKNSIMSHQFDRLSLSDCKLVCLCDFDTDNCVIDNSSSEFNRTVTYLNAIMDTDDNYKMYLDHFFNELNTTFSSDIKKALEKLSK